jgi:riboflavin synthase
VFTGLVECIGRVVSVSRASGGVSVISIEAPAIASEVKAGESVAVAGACLTAVGGDGKIFQAQMMEETLRATRLGAVKPGDSLNLERATRLGGRLDGHIVLGHVDETGAVMSVEANGSAKKIWISASGKISWGIAQKGSIAVDGVSLTVIDSEDGGFSIGLIPTTLRETTLGLLERGKQVNIEIDVTARYIARIMGRTPEGGGVTWEKLARCGW